MDIRIIYSRSFIKSAKKLPSPVKKKLAALLEGMGVNPFAPNLHTKPLAGKLAGLYSLRITRDWRVIFYFKGKENIVLIDASHRSDVYK